MEKLSTSYSDFSPLSIDFNDMEATEINLIEMAHTASMHEDDRTKAFGRALKSVAPGWVDFLKKEMERDDEGGPTNCIVGLTKTFALLTAMAALPATKNARKARELANGITALFGSDIDLLVKFFQEKTNAKEHARSET